MANGPHADRIGPYALVRPLGAGGAGEVWEAVLQGPGGFRKPVALKILRAPPGGADGAALREARLGALLQHPNVVATLQVGVHDDTWCIALELVRGVSVETLSRRAGGALPGGVVLEIGLQVCAGLQHVHAFVVDGRRAGLVHRDVKPANLLVDRTGLVKVADLGISMLAGESDAVAGTASYMAPEQTAGRPEPRSDLFSLGAVLYTIATGRQPFGRGEAARTAIERVEALLAHASFLAPVEVAAPGLGEVVRSCLRHDPALRPASARELGQALVALRARAPAGPTLFELLARSAPGLDLGIHETPLSDVPTRVVPSGNTRSPRDAFVGRREELAAVEALVRTERWVVLVGPGGVGKTRLALEVARRLRARVPGGAWAFDLSAARTPEAVCQALGQGLELELERRDPVGQVGRVLRAKGQALVVLDNLEQAVEALPATLGRWIDHAPEVAFLGTSRVAPGLLAERLVPLGPLAQDDAVKLFTTRAPRSLSSSEEAEVASLCRALEDVPLAIELAAARLRILDVGEVRARLSLALLAGGSPEMPSRHRSVLASLRWSLELLGPAARSALARLSVFEGGFDPAAAEAVLRLGDTPGAPWALDVLQELVDASLLQVDPSTGRFRMGMLVHAFAAGLLSPADRTAAEERHGAHFAQLGSPEAIAALAGPRGPDRLKALVRELANLLAACRRAVARGAGEVAVATLTAADEALVVQGPASLRAELSDAVVRLPGLSPGERARAGRRAAWAAWHLGQAAEAVRWFEQARDLAREAGDRSSEGLILWSQGVLQLRQGRTDEARMLIEQALAVHRETGNRTLEAVALGSLGTLLAELGRPDDARAHFEQALAVHRRVGNRRFEGIVLGNLGSLAADLGRSAEAERLLAEALAVHREVENRRSEAVALGNLGDLLHRGGRTDEARRRYEEALALHRAVGDARFEAIVLVRLGEVAPEPRQARGYLEQGLVLLRELGDRREEGAALRGLAAAVLAEEGPAAAGPLLDRAEALLREVQAPAELAGVLVLRAEVGLRRGEVAAATAALAEADALAGWNAAVAREIAGVRGRLG